MTVTKVDIWVNNNSSKNNILAYASVVLDSELCIHDIKLIKRNDDSTFIAMPSKRLNQEEKFLDIVHPCNAEFRTYLHTEILNAYNEYVKSMQVETTGEK